MAAEHRKLLEQLMGSEAFMTGGPGSRGPQLSITDPKVCRSYLVGTCVHDRFTNTKGDTGPCPQVHSEALKAEYEAADDEQKKRWGFDFDYMRDMQKHVEHCNRRIEEAQKRLEKTPDEIRQTNQHLNDISDLTSTIDNGILEVFTLATAAKAVNIAVTEHFKLTQSQQRKADVEHQLKALSDTGGPSGHQKLQVCDVCGAYLSRLDNDRRLADHFWGKMHLGYAQMRRQYEELRKELKGRAPPVREEEAAPAQDAHARGEERWGREGGGRGFGGRGGGRGGRGGGYRGGRGGGGGGGGGYGGGRW